MTGSFLTGCSCNPCGLWKLLFHTLVGGGGGEECGAKSSPEEIEISGRIMGSRKSWLR